MIGHNHRHEPCASRPSVHIKQTASVLLDGLRTSRASAAQASPMLLDPVLLDPCGDVEASRILGLGDQPRHKVRVALGLLEKSAH